jgi:hypothetical protein
MPEVGWVPGGVVVVLEMETGKVLLLPELDEPPNLGVQPANIKCAVNTTVKKQNRNRGFKDCIKRPKDSPRLTFHVYKLQRYAEILLGQQSHHFTQIINLFSGYSDLLVLNCRLHFNIQPFDKLYHLLAGFF